MGRRFCIVGTAGHIDHGKSALVKALTGTDPDRLPEEKSRGMTIVLGFARLSLPDPQGTGEPVQIGVVDVPGHERFIRTMVAGATGIDLGLLVVAADDGVMPQTREHVEILDLLGVNTGIVAITKSDAVHETRVAEVETEIGDLLAPTALRDWPLVATSAKTGRGLDELRAALLERIGGLPPRPESAVFRLAIDRVFPIRGRGTVVTGSVLSGKVAPGEMLELHPAGRACKVREVQSHGEAVRDVVGGQRAALNLTGLEREAIERGMELATPGYLTKSRYVDARVRLLGRLDKPFPSHRRARVSMATWEAMAMLVAIGTDHIAPGRETPVQLRFVRPVVAAYGQRFILRNESSSATIGGGMVLRPCSTRVRPNDPRTLEALRRAESPDPFVRFGEAVRRAGFIPYSVERLACEVGVEPREVAEFQKQLEAQDLLTAIGTRSVHRDTIETIERRALAYLERHHANRPTEPGVSKDRFVGWIEAQAPGLGRPLFERLRSRELIAVRGPYVTHHAFRPALSEEDAALMAQLVAEVTAAGFDPPEWPKLKTIGSLSRPRAKALADLVKIEPALTHFAPQRYIAADALDRFKQTVRTLGSGGRKFKLADVRDALGLSRRVVQPLLEHLDRTRFTKRVGDERILLEESSASTDRN